MTVAAVLVAAGSGSRLGADLPKAFVQVAGRSLLEHALARFAADPRVGEIVVVAPPGWVDRAKVLTAPATVVEGGAMRQQSVDLGVRALSPRAEVVLVHDVARPFVPQQVIDRVLAALAGGADAVVPALPVTDTVKQIAPDGTVLATIERARLVAVQTPQGFRRSALVAAHEAAPDTSASDDAALVEALGGAVVVVRGDEDAFKITTPRDLLLAEAVAARG
jgi:2-C-methyl-D-erythritol 4-phosphate cytidylyltransferase